MHPVHVAVRVLPSHGRVARVQVLLSLRPLVFAPTEIIFGNNLYILHHGVAVYGGKVISAGGVWGEDMLIYQQTLRSRFFAKVGACASARGMWHVACASAPAWGRGRGLVRARVHPLTRAARPRCQALHHVDPLPWPILPSLALTYPTIPCPGLSYHPLP
jgi:hypothetical protein